MNTTNDLAEIGALVGDPSRAGMLAVLMDGRALTAGELAGIAGVTPQTASGHLTRLTQGGLLAVEKQNRHRYYRLASPTVARLLEGMMEAASLAAAKTRPKVVPRMAVEMRAARTCYDHLAGLLGIAIVDSLTSHGHLELTEDGGALTSAGTAFFEAQGIALPTGGKRVFCRPCLDWSERRPHIGGTLGAVLCTHLFDQGWVRRIDKTRAVGITPRGHLELKRVFDVRLG